MSHSFPLPPNLPRPVDDGACRHLPGMRVPDIALPSTAGSMVNLSSLSWRRSVVYCYPRTGVPGEALPKGWDLIPGARGCTPQSCGFRDHYSEIRDMGAEVFGFSTQDTDYQREMAQRLQLPFEVLSDAGYKFCDALRLPTFEVEGMRLVKRLTLMILNGVIETVFYPVFPPDKSAAEVIEWLHKNPVAGG